MVEGSVLILPGLVELVDRKIESSFGDQLNPYKEVLRTTEDILESEFHQVAYLKPKAIDKLKQLDLQVPNVTTIW